MMVMIAPDCISPDQLEQHVQAIVATGGDLDPHQMLGVLLMTVGYVISHTIVHNDQLPCAQTFGNNLCQLVEANGANQRWMN